MPRAASQLHSNVPTELLLALKARLERLCDTSHDLATAASPKHVTFLKTAAADLQAASTGPIDIQVAPEQPLLTAATACIDLLTKQLQDPPASLYSDLSGAPCQPSVELKLVALTFQEAVAANLQLLLAIMQLLGDVEVNTDDQQIPGYAEGNERSRNKPYYVVGIVEITEADSSSTAITAEQEIQQQLQKLVLQTLLVCALYAPSYSLSGNRQHGYSSIKCVSTSTNCGSSPNGAVGAGAPHTSSSSNTGSLPTDLGAHCGAVAQQGLVPATPWSATEAQQHCSLILQHLAAHVTGPDTTAAALATARSTRCNSSMPGFSRVARPHATGLQPCSSPSRDNDLQQCQQDQQQQQEQDSAWQQLVAALLPQLLDQLRDTLLAQHRHRKAQDRGDTGAYNGPDTFHRCLAARQLAWITQQLPPLTADDHLGLLLPLILATTDDSSPSMQRYGHAMLSWVSCSCAASSLRFQSALLLDAAKRMVVGCEASCWEMAMPAATHLVLALEGKNVRAEGYHMLMKELLTEAERSAHKPQQRLIFLACVALLIPRLGLYILRYFAQLMPLLLEWAHAYDEKTVVVALWVLATVVQHAWPRIEAHAGVIWQHLVQVAKAAEARKLDRGVDSYSYNKQQQEEQGRAQNGQQPPGKVFGDDTDRQVKVAADVAGCSDRSFAAVLQLLNVLKQCGSETLYLAVAATAQQQQNGVGSSSSIARMVRCIFGQ